MGVRPARRGAAPRGRPAAARGTRWLAPLAIAAAGLYAYRNSFSNPFLFDDLPHIVRNPLIRALWPPWSALAHTTRPLVQLSRGRNHPRSGDRAGGDHPGHRGIPLRAGLTLLGILRRSFAAAGTSPRIREAAAPLALAAALLWVVHPLQTESVTYVIQRAEALAGLCYLLTLYAVIRGAAAARPGRWHVAAVAACALGMASKPVAATAPVAVLIYDRMFLSGSFARLWSARRRLHAGLFGTLALLPLMFANGPDEWRTSAGLAVPGLTPIAYAATEPGVILHYLRLCLWPHPLVLDYGWPIARAAGAIVIPALVVAGLVAISIVASLRGRRLGFLGIWFFLVLSPTSSFVPIADPAFEHRLYLPLAAVTTLATLAGFEVLTRSARRLAWPPSLTRAVAMAVVVALAGTLATLTARRNADYRSDLAMWSDTVAKRPGNVRARTSLGLVLVARGRTEDGLAELERAVRLDPRDGMAQLGLGYSLAAAGRSDQALPHAREAARLLPDHGEAQFLLGTLLLDRRQVPEARARLREALRLEPERAATHYDLGLVAELEGRWSEAIDQYAEAVRLKPDFADAHCNLGLALARTGHPAEARRELEAALGLDPGHARARQGLEQLGRPPAPE